MTAIKNPTKFRHGNLQWTHHGTVHATYFVESIEYGLKAPADKEEAKDSHETLVLGCPAPYCTLASLQVPMDVVDCMARMLDTINLRATPAYIDEVLAGYQRIVEIGPLTRLNLLTLPIGQRSPLAAMPDHAEIEQAHAHAAEAVSAVDPENVFRLSPVPEGLLPFVWNHNLMRGAAVERAPSDPAAAIVADTSPGRTFLPGTLDEGARTEKPWWRSFNPILKTMVRRDDGHVIDSYQALLTPRSFARMQFPGQSEFLSLLDGLHVDGEPINVDWVMRIRRRDREAAMKDNEKMLGKLGIQLTERESKVGFHSRELHNKVLTLVDYNDRLAANENAEEVEFTTVLAVGSSTESDLARKVGALKAKYRSKLAIRLEAPRGTQARFWHLFNPGAPAADDYSDYKHVITTSDWGGLVPFTTARLLDDVGPVIGVNLLSGLYEPLHFNFLRKAEGDHSPAIAVAGELGAGKSYFVKTLCATIVDLNGRFLAVDKAGEYLDLAHTIPGSVIVNLGAANPGFTLDPLQLFADWTRGREVALDTVLPLLNIPATSRQGTLLSKLLRPDERSAHNLHSLADVRDHCARMGAGHSADARDYADITDAMDAVEAHVLFDRGLPALPLGAPATIVRTHTLSLPRAQELQLAHAYANLPWRKRLGHALYELVGFLAREEFLRPDGRFGALVADEAYHFTAAPIGQQIVEEFVREGRRNSAGLILASHDPKADYAGVAHGLIPNRFGFRHRDKGLATNTLEWLGADTERDSYLVKQMQKHTSPPQGKREIVPINRRGECFIADSRGRIGRGKILGPARADRAQAVSTTPNAARSIP